MAFVSSWLMARFLMAEWPNRSPHRFTILSGLAGVIGPVITTQVFAEGEDWPLQAVAGVVGFFGGLAVLWALALLCFWFRAPSYRLAGAQESLVELTESIEEGAESSFELTHDLEEVGWLTNVNGEFFQHAAVGWIWVQNNGPTSTFAAQIVDVRGVPPEWGSPYKVAEAAWDGKHTPYQHIPHGGSRKLKVFSLLAIPRAFWFWTSEHQAEAPGYQWHLADEETPTIEFITEVVNVGGSDESARVRGEVTIPEDLDDATFSLEPV